MSKEVIINSPQFNVEVLKPNTLVKVKYNVAVYNKRQFTTNALVLSCKPLELKVVYVKDEDYKISTPSTTVATIGIEEVNNKEVEVTLL